MNHAAHNKLVSFIWSIADDCLRDVYVRGKYRDVILPMVVLRRLDSLLEPTKAKVLKDVEFQRNEMQDTELDDAPLQEASGYVFYNTSKWTMRKLHDTATNNQQILLANVEDYLNGFSDNVIEIVERFKLKEQMRHMANKDVLLDVLEKFVSPDINLTPHEREDPDGNKLPALSNLGMGYVFEELIRKFNEDNNEEAGEHFTPREVIQLMTHLVFDPIKDKLPPILTIYDPACGSGGMLTESQNFIKDAQGAIRATGDVYLYGKEINDETYAICKSDMMIKGDNPQNIKVGSTLSTDEFAGKRFDFMLSNPPYGKSWSSEIKYIKDGQDVIDPRFRVELADYWGENSTVDATPRSSDGQLLFLMEMVSKMKSTKDNPLGARIASVHNGSSLFTGDAGGGESNIRRYLIENDLLDAIVQMPNNLFYNTGITTYIWLLSNNKPEQRKGKVQLIDANLMFRKLRKNLGDKNCEFSPEHIEQITRAYLDFAPIEREIDDNDEPTGLAVQIFDNADFGYFKVIIERPDRRCARFSEKRLAPLRFDKSLREVKRNSSVDWQRKILERFDRLIKKHGILHLLKKGLAVDDAFFNLMYPAPLASSAQSVVDNFAANIFSLTRQVRYSLANPREEIDLALFINGLPLVSIELKNPWTGQNARYHGQKQYRLDRDPNQPLLQFGRCLVHMAVDTDEVYMTTKLAGKDTFFLPFNKGHNSGAGNPPNENGHKSAYLWQEIFTRQSLANIIQHFVRLDGSIKDPLGKRTLFFPRFHQLDVVRRLLDHAASHGAGQTYLIEHSAGSGKSNSITWAAFQLIETYREGEDKPLFDSVIVVTDRRLLDKQLRENIKEFSEVKNIITAVQSSRELKSALESGKKIIITTIQKFPFIIDGIADLGDRRFAVIIDEAHSSQSGSAHDNMNRAMGKEKGKDDRDTVDTQDKIIEAMQSRKMRGNASYLAFTATPKPTTLEKFGQQLPDGSFVPFHLYSMKQAIEEGFILDVLANYTTYKSYYEIEKSITENPEFDTKKAQKKLRAYVESSQQTINTKAEIMLEHFIPSVVNSRKLRGKAKGMIITQNIVTAIRYYKAVTSLLEKQGHPFKVLISFSGDKEVDGISYSEAGLNGFAENKTRDKFDTDEYRLLIVANKYLTGFDQPKLAAMYVDKKLQGVLAVQALSRLNRSAPKLGKKTEDLFILDFFNSVDDIKDAFDPFYTSTSLSEATDVNVLHELKDMLDDVGVYEGAEVEDFVARYFNNEEAENLSKIIDVAASRFNEELELENDDKVDFKIKAKQFVKIYGQMASIMPFEVVAWEKLFWFLKFLVPKLLIKDPNQDKLDELLNAVDLSSYGLERVKLNHAIGLDDSETEVDPQNPNPRGSHADEEKDQLDEIIKTFNERWFQGWSATPEEQRVKFINIADSIRAHPDFPEKYKNNPDPHTRELAFEKMLQDIMLTRRKDELELYKLFANDPAFKASWQQSMERILSRDGS